MSSVAEALLRERDDAVIKRAAWELEAKTQKARAERLEAVLREIAAEASVPVRTKKKGGIKHKWMYRGWRKVAVERIDIARAALKGADHD
jgi:hypothetical protein